MFTGMKDEGLLRFMAEKTVELADIDAESKTQTLKSKYRAIEQMRTAATSREVCFRSAIVQYFGEALSPKKRTLAVRLAEWIFSRSARVRRTRLCCDRCDRVRVDNVIDWAVRVFASAP